MTFGKRLMQLRKEHGYRNRDAFAAELGIPANTLRNYEMDIREPGFPFLIKMSQLFHVSTDYLLGLTEERATTAVDVQSISEQQLIEKYRLLDCTGKELVDYTIAIELKRTTLLENQKNRILHYEQAFKGLWLTGRKCSVNTASAARSRTFYLRYHGRIRKAGL